MKRKTHEEFITELKKINSNIEILSQYKTYHEKVLCRCKVDGYEWYARSSVLLSGKGCHKCKSKSISDCLKSSHEEFVEKLAKKHPHIQAISKYERSHKHMTFFCTIHDYEFQNTPNGILNSKFGCSKCSNTYSIKTIDEVNQYLKENSFYIVCLNYAGSEKDVSTFQCSKDKTIWSVSFGQIKYNACVCPSCSKTRRLTQEEFISRVKSVNPKIKVLGEYKTSTQKVKCKCEVCGHQWFPVASNIINNGQGCPQCCVSKGELKIEKFLEENNIFYETQKQFDGLVGLKGKSLSYDFFLQDYNLLIEYQGQFHDGTAKLQNKEKLAKQQEHDKRKRNYSNLHNIELLEIWYQDFDKIEQILSDKINELKEK